MIYGIRTLLHLRAAADVETHLVMTEAACVNILLETQYTVDEVRSLADVAYRPDNLAAAISSGSFKTDGMIVAPCSVKSLSGIVYSFADNLLCRAADVCLKEKRKLVLVVRETPLHKGHLELMVKAAELVVRSFPRCRPSITSRKPLRRSSIIRLAKRSIISNWITTCSAVGERNRPD